MPLSSAGGRYGALFRNVVEPKGVEPSTSITP